MSKQRPFPVMTAPQDAPGNVVPMRRARWYDIAAPMPGSKSGRRETSWRDLVRRLAKSLAKR